MLEVRSRVMVGYDGEDEIDEFGRQKGFDLELSER